MGQPCPSSICTGGDKTAVTPQLSCFQSWFYNAFLIFHRLLLAKRRHSLSVIHGQKCLIRASLPGNITEVDALDPLPQIRLRAWKLARFWQWFLLAPGGHCREGILDDEKFAVSFVKHRSLVGGSGDWELTKLTWIFLFSALFLCWQWLWGLLLRREWVTHLFEAMKKGSVCSHWY